MFFCIKDLSPCNQLITKTSQALGLNINLSKSEVGSISRYCTYRLGSFLENWKVKASKKSVYFGGLVAYWKIKFFVCNWLIFGLFWHLAQVCILVHSSNTWSSDSNVIWGQHKKDRGLQLGMICQHWFFETLFLYSYTKVILWSLQLCIFQMIELCFPHACRLKVFG